MAGTRRFIKVFLASPGDLSEERKIAKEIVDEFNSQLASALECQVELVGWEDTLPGVGRPQAIINRDLDGCDFFVGMLWKRWGTAPGVDAYTSGFEEEFNRSMSRNAAEGRPEISLLLKDLDAASLADPGDHLKKVIAFRDRVFSEKKLLCGTFADIRDFESKFRRCIQGYVIGLADKNRSSAVENDQAPSAETQTIPTSEPGPETPLSIEGAVFLRNFLVAAEKATEENPLGADDVARLRLLSVIVAVHGNDRQSLGSHDANLLFKAREKFEFGRRELNGLLVDGLSHFTHDNVPLWHWLAAVDGFKKHILQIHSVIGAVERRVGAIKAMRQIAEPIVDKVPFDRSNVISLWLGEASEAELRIAALEYLGEFGQAQDLPRIKAEVDRNDTQTIGVAADAVVRITLRDDRRGALEALYSLQPSTVRPDLLDELFSLDAEFDSEVLLRGLSHCNAQVRTVVVTVLQRRHALDPSAAESLLNDSCAAVRFLALRILVESGRSYSLDQAKAILVPNKSVKTGLGLSAPGYTDAAGEAAFERYRDLFFGLLTIEQLEAQAQLVSVDQGAYFALVKRDFRRHGDDLRRAVANLFESRFLFLLEEMERRYGAQAGLIDNFRSLEEFLCKKFSRVGLDVICKRLDPADLALVRTSLASGKLDYSSADLKYLAKFGQWCDIPLVIASLDKPDYDRKYESLLSIANSSRYENAARALYALGKHRLKDLLAVKMPGRLLSCIIRIIPDSSFQLLDESDIVSLMRSDSDDVRKLASLKFIRAFPRHRIKAVLESYMAADQFYYNVVHWLDFGISVPKERMLRAAGRLLAAK